MNLLLMKPFSFFFPVWRTLYAMDTISLDRKQVLVWLWIELTYRTFGGGDVNARTYECFVWFKKMKSWINTIYEIIKSC